MPVLALGLVPALLCLAPAPPETVEVAAHVFVLRGVPTGETWAVLRRLHITHVIDFRRDEELAGEDPPESTALRAIDAEYMRFALTRTPPAADFSFIREILRSFPRGARILLHCSNGNRAAAAACAWLVLDKGLPTEEALNICRRAGLVVPETEASVKDYLRLHARS